MSMCSHYVYKPLQSQSKEIRVLTLLPDVPGTEINCRLDTISLDDQPQYEALSYVWGSSTDREKVQIEGKEALVTTSLERALQHLRHPEQKRFLWADALCIDQQNNSEKSWQVQLMGDIYRKASSTVVWLGKNDVYIDQAYDLLELFMQEKYPIESATEQQWIGLEKIFLHAEWWTRLWVVQELVFGQKVVLVCGSRSISWKIMQELLPQLLPGDQIGTRSGNKRLMKVFKKPIGLFMIKLTDPLRPTNTSKQLVRLENVIETLSSKRKCTDPRDVIYALLGLSVKEVYMDFTRLMMNREGRLDLLCNTYYEDTRHHDPVSISSPGGRCPSWSVDWSMSRRVESLINTYPPNSCVFYDADGGVLVGDEILKSGVPSTLVLQGVVFDTIISVSTSFSDLQNWQALVRKWIPRPITDFEKKVYVHSEEDMLSAYMRTLLRDVEWHSFGMPAGRLNAQQIQSYGKHFRYWLEHPEHDGDFDKDWTPDVDSDILGKRELEYFLACSLVNWCLVSTEKGYIGLVENLARAGDRIAVVYGACTPLILRDVSIVESTNEDSDGNTFTKVCAGYIHGVMDGEVMRMLGSSELEKRSIFLA
ncbi:heterokaryon incompatibility protein [Rutstroemia sp. NJR-2017a WRK4]|nr:heterokaryon incompatibility protein [Rutstroemia sp. NJR-2017a WRK4]